MLACINRVGWFERWNEITCNYLTSDEIHGSQEQPRTLRNRDTVRPSCEALFTYPETGGSTAQLNRALDDMYQATDERILDETPIPNDL